MYIKWVFSQITSAKWRIQNTRPVPHYIGTHKQFYDHLIEQRQIETNPTKSIEIKAYRYTNDCSTTLQINPSPIPNAQVGLRMTEGTLKRRFRTLLARKMLTKLPDKSMSKHLFRVNPFHQLPPITEESTFETMQGEWKDFVGFLEF